MIHKEIHINRFHTCFDFIHSNISITFARIVNETMAFKGCEHVGQACFERFINPTK